MIQIVFSTLIAFLAVGCGGPHYIDYFPYHDDGTPKPKVALIPLNDASNCKFPWDVSQELSEAIYNELMNSGEAYVLLPEEVGPVWTKHNSIDFFSNDMSFCKQFNSADFIVATELVDQKIQSSNPCEAQFHPCNQVLSIAVRLKVIDVRCDQPRVVLYEIVQAEYSIAPKKACEAYDEICWGSYGFPKTPCGILHQRLVSKLTSRLNEVLWSAK